METSLSNKFEAISYFECIYQIEVCLYIICTFFIVISLNIFVCSYSCKLSYKIFHLLPQVIYSNYSVFCVVSYAEVTCIGYFLMYTVTK